MSADKQTLIRRARMVQAIRRHFDDNGFVEVQTPVRIETPALEDYIDAIGADGKWLRTSPELHMKRLVARGMDRIYQIGPCFRADEHGLKHRTEFTMLEWYEGGASYRELIPFTQTLVRRAAEAIEEPVPSCWREMTVDAAFREYAQKSATDACSEGRFDQLLVDQVEPSLGEGAVFLMDYPVELGALARISPSNPDVAERWELYVRGLEIANTFSELTDVDEQRRRFEAAATLRLKDGRTAYPIDEEFMKELANMPPTAGSALGVDRLFMALTGLDDIGSTLAF
jgi:lysyl-tRNA synthetase class 2